MEPIRDAGASGKSSENPRSSSEPPPSGGGERRPESPTAPASSADQDLVSVPPVEAPITAADEEALPERLKTLLIGKPRDLRDKSLYHSVSLVALLAWVGLGADGLSSSCYGPAEAFFHLGDHSYLAVFLALATVLTVLVISACYSQLIEEYSTGGGGYVVASKELGSKVGLISGCALLVDYVLTITVSISAAGDALFGLLGPNLIGWKLPAEFAAIVVLIVLNLRGVRESVILMLPVFVLFLATHAVLIVGGVILHSPQIGEVSAQISDQVRSGLADPKLGFLGMLSLLLYAYSLGAGTYTGIEAVSNSMAVMREPRVATGRRTMLYMAISLSLTAGGLIIGYLLFDVRWNPLKTMNLVFTEAFVGELGLRDTLLGGGFILLTLLSEGALLMIAGQAGFIDGPRILANMAIDSWVPHWFGSLSERLAIHNGILLMGLSALGLLLYTHGNVSALVVMYSINVFVTFSLSMLGMCHHWWVRRRRHPLWKRRFVLFAVGLCLCAGILSVTVVEKFDEGGWKTLLVTGVCVGLCALTKRHYGRVIKRLKRLDESLGQLVTPASPPNMAPPDPNQPVAAILVGGYSGLGVHTLLNSIRFAPAHFKSAVFLSVGVVDSGTFKGAGAVDELRRHTEASLEKYVDLTRRLGLPSASFMAIGTDAVDELEQLCREIARQYPKVIFFAGQLMFRRDTWLQRLMHNQTAYSLQRRLQWEGLPMVILPTRVR